MIKPFGLKAARFIKRPPAEDARINILEGAVRSAKTWAISARLIGLLSQGWWPGGIGLISGVSKATIKTNVLNDVFSIVGQKRYKYNQQSGELNLLGRPFLVCGARDEGSWKFIRGSTIGLWIADEITIYPRSFWDMALSRLSLPQSRMFGSTNPGNPWHFLKTDYLDNPVLKANGDLWSQHFTLEDNPNVTDETKEFLQRLYTGVFKLRYIDGLWVIAEGAIYRDVLTEEVFYTNEWRDANLPGLRNNGGHAARYVGIDYGTHNPMVFTDVYDDGDTLWFDREWYYDSQEHNVQLTDGQYADRLIEFMGQLPAEVILDPSAASFAAELKTRGIYAADADNDVLDGIRVVSSMLARKKMRINRDGCPKGIREMETYSWNPISSKRGVEEPIKDKDHFCDNIRYVAKTKINEWRLAA